MCFYNSNTNKINFNNGIIETNNKYLTKILKFLELIIFYINVTLKLIIKIWIKNFLLKIIWLYIILSQKFYSKFIFSLKILLSHFLLTI